MKRILVVEDDIIIGGGVKLFLERKGYEAVHALDLSQAREIKDRFYT